MPCAFALQTAKVPAARWATRADLLSHLHRGRDFVLTAPVAAISLRAAADAAGLSPFHFQRAFRATFGYSPLELLNHRRLSLAIQLLQESGRPQWWIAHEIGLNGAPALHRFLQCQAGHSLNQLRKKRQFPDNGRTPN